MSIPQSGGGPIEHHSQLAEYMVPTPRELEDSDLRRTIVWRVEAE